MDSGTNPSYLLNMGTHNDKTAPQQTRTNPKPNFARKNLQQWTQTMICSCSGSKVDAWILAQIPAME
jgi:hypothetical protein